MQSQRFFIVTHAEYDHLVIIDIDGYDHLDNNFKMTALLLDLNVPKQLLKFSFSKLKICRNIEFHKSRHLSNE